jgi:hypothetical protein
VHLLLSAQSTLPLKKPEPRIAALNEQQGEEVDYDLSLSLIGFVERARAKEEHLPYLVRTTMWCEFLLYICERVA